MHRPNGGLMFRNAVISGIALATVASCMVLGGTANGATLKSPYVVGDIGTYSGPSASNSIGGRDALNAWAKYTNARGGINGHAIKVISMDDQGTGSVGLTEAKELVQDHVIALVGNIGITEDAWDTYMSHQPIPVIGDALDTNATTTYKNFFPEGTTQSSNYFYGVPKVASVLGKKKYAVIYCAEVSSCLQIADSQKHESAAAGVSYIYSTAASATATSYIAPCLAAKNSGADAVALLLAEQTAALVAAACEQQGFKPQWLQSSTGFTSAEASVRALNGTAGPVNDFPWFASDNAAERTFQEAMRKYEPQDFTSSGSGGYSESAALAWSAATIFGAAAAKLPASGVPTGAQLMQKLYELPKGDTFGGLTPPITYVADRAQPQVKCFFGIQLKDHSYTVVKDGKYICQS